MLEKIQETQDLQVPITVDSQGNVDVKTNPSKKNGIHQKPSGLT